MKMKIPKRAVKRTLAVCLTFFLLFSLSACNLKPEQPTDRVSRVVGIDASSGTVLDCFDTHGGFHGDGKTYIAIKFDENTVEEAIKQNPNWKPYPLDDTVGTLLYGYAFNHSISAGPYLGNDSGEPLFPTINSGYYFFRDRQDDADPEQDILKRYSFNFTVAIYDQKTMTLYYGELDT